jgi:arabinose-5-phosphate isomerase
LDDVIIAISNSGNSSEIIELLPFSKRFGIKVIAFTGNRNSQLAQDSDICIDISIKMEACPFDMEHDRYTFDGRCTCRYLVKKEGFAVLHPGGSLGKSLLLRVKDLMQTGESHPSVKHDIPLKTAICEMTSKGLGMTVVDEKGFLSGLITDGDLRRILEAKGNIMELPVQEVMIRNPKTIKGDILAAEALRKMGMSSITSLIIVDDENRPYGTIHLHDILKAGIA